MTIKRQDYRLDQKFVLIFCLSALEYGTPEYGIWFSKNSLTIAILLWQLKSVRLLSLYFCGLGPIWRYLTILIPLKSQNYHLIPIIHNLLINVFLTFHLSLLINIVYIFFYEMYFASTLKILEIYWISNTFNSSPLNLSLNNGALNDSLLLIIDWQVKKIFIHVIFLIG